MKLCELKVQSQADREKLICIIAESGYKVSIDVRYKDQLHGFGHEQYYVIIESKCDEAEVKE